MQCKKCGNQFPCRIWIDGKRRNLHNRKFCLDCSPFNSHNTSSKLPSDPRKDKNCKQCGRLIKASSKCGHTCHCCWQKKKEIRRSDDIHAIVGDSCWFCEYEKDRRILDFHHVDPSTKEFNVNLRNASNLSWLRVLKEIKKCVLACCRCHREIEYKHISKKEVNKIFKKRWR